MKHPALLVLAAAAVGVALWLVMDGVDRRGRDVRSAHEEVPVVKRDADELVGSPTSTTTPPFVDEAPAPQAAPVPPDDGLHPLRVVLVAGEHGPTDPPFPVELELRELERPPGLGDLLSFPFHQPGSCTREDFDDQLAELRQELRAGAWFSQRRAPDGTLRLHGGLYELRPANFAQFLRDDGPRSWVVDVPRAEVVTLRLWSPARLRGVVVGPDGAPVDACLLHAYADADRARLEWSREADGPAAARFDWAVPARSLVLEARVPAERLAAIVHVTPRPFEERELTITLEPASSGLADARLDVVLEGAREPHELRLVRVLRHQRPLSADHTNSPLARVEGLQHDDPSAPELSWRAAADPFTTFDDLFAGHYGILVRGASEDLPRAHRLLGWVELARGEHGTATFALDAPGETRLVGVVVDAAGEPVDAEVGAFSPGRPTIGNVFHRSTRQGAYFDVTLPDGGPWTLGARPREAGGAWRTLEVLVDPNRTTEVRFELPGGSLEVVLDVPGEAFGEDDLPRATLVQLDTGLENYPYAHAELTGDRYRFDHLPDGRYRFVPPRVQGLGFQELAPFVVSGAAEVRERLSLTRERR